MKPCTPVTRQGLTIVEPTIVDSVAVELVLHSIPSAIEIPIIVNSTELPIHSWEQKRS